MATWALYIEFSFKGVDESNILVVEFILHQFVILVFVSQCMRTAVKVKLTVHWPIMSKTDIGDRAVKVKPSPQYSVTFCSRWQQTQASDMKVHVKPRFPTEFHHIGKKKWYPVTSMGAC